eukprot:1963985-Rhodomonas_salina.1
MRCWRSFLARHAAASLECEAARRWLAASREVRAALRASWEAGDMSGSSALCSERKSVGNSCSSRSRSFFTCTCTPAPPRHTHTHTHTRTHAHAHAQRHRDACV